REAALAHERGHERMIAPVSAARARRRGVTGQTNVFARGTRARAARVGAAGADRRLGRAVARADRAVPRAFARRRAAAGALADGTPVRGRLRLARPRCAPARGAARGPGGGSVFVLACFFAAATRPRARTSRGRIVASATRAGRLAEASR